MPKKIHLLLLYQWEGKFTTVRASEDYGKFLLLKRVSMPSKDHERPYLGGFKRVGLGGGPMEIVRVFTKQGVWGTIDLI